MQTAPYLFGHRKYWARRFGVAPFLPMSRAEMDALGWDSCDVIVVTGDAYVDHPSFGMALIGRLLEAQGFRVGIISQPDWHSAADFRALGKPNLFFGITAGNMDSMVNRYTADRRIRSDDAYTPDGAPNRRPDRAVTVYAQRAREAFPEANIVIGSIEASLRRIAHYDYWSDKVRRSVLPDSKADLLLFGNAERAIVTLAHRLAAGEPIAQIRDLRGSAFMAPRNWRPEGDWVEVDSTEVDAPGPLVRHPDPYAMEAGPSVAAGPVADPAEQVLRFMRRDGASSTARARWCACPPTRPCATTRCCTRTPRAPSRGIEPRQRARAGAGPRRARRVDQSAADPAHHARDGRRLRPALPAQAASGLRRGAHPRLRDDPLLGQHHARLLRRLHLLLDHRARGPHHPEPLGEIGPARDREDPRPHARLHRRDLGPRRAHREHVPHRLQEPRDRERLPAAVVRLPGMCENLNTDHSAADPLYRKARELPGIKKVLIASGVRYDLAIDRPEYVKELAQHHVGGYLKIAPEAIGEGPLSKMMKPGIGTYERFKELFDRFSREAGKEQYLIPYFIAAHPGTPTRTCSSSRCG
jgi:radical SAM superfamily enzyme YgiQ (UPF0313 family)